MSRFLEYLKSLVSETIISSSVGGGAGSIIKIEFENSNYIFVYCCWRLEHLSRVLSSSEDNAEPLIGLMANTIKNLENKKVVNIDVSPQYDLVLDIEENYTLRVFCNISYTNEDYSNWELCSPQNDLIFTISNQYKVDSTSYF